MEVQPVSEQVYVLGAGASCHAGYPVIADFVDRLFSLPDPGGSLGVLLDILRRFREQFLPDGNIEELLGLSEFLRYHQYIDVYNLMLTASANFPKEYLIPSVRVGILYLLAHLAKQTKRSETYDQFADTVRGAIISFNWDALLDESLADLRALDWPYAGASDGLNEIRYLKLHGSVNVVFCPSCGWLSKMEPTQALNIAIERREGNCPKCGGRQEFGNTVFLTQLTPLIIGPSISKGPEMARMPLLLEQWTIARRVLTQCDRITFMGFSMAPGDFHATSLFRSALAARKGKSLEVTVVTPRPSATLVHRYQDIFLDEDTNEVSNLVYKGDKYGCLIILNFVDKRFEDFVGENL